jgi:uncharacterized protein (TIGR00252 family)
MSPVHTTLIGRRAEIAAAAYLARQGYKIVERNWHTRWCEIDIVAIKDTVISFVEVKYRRREVWGFGLEYVTPAKQRQMAFAAQFWVTSHEWSGSYDLAAVEVSGPSYKVTQFVPSLEAS